MFYCAYDYFSESEALFRGVKSGATCLSFDCKEERDFFFKQRFLFEHAVSFEDGVDLSQFKNTYHFKEETGISLKERIDSFDKNYLYGSFNSMIEKTKNNRKYFYVKDQK